MQTQDPLVKLVEWLMSSEARNITLDIEKERRKRHFVNDRYSIPAIKRKILEYYKQKQEAYNPEQVKEISLKYLRSQARQFPFNTTYRDLLQTLESGDYDFRFQGLT